MVGKTFKKGFRGFALCQAIEEAVPVVVPMVPGSGDTCGPRGSEG